MIVNTSDCGCEYPFIRERGERTISSSLALLMGQGNLEIQRPLVFHTGILFLIKIFFNFFFSNEVLMLEAKVVRACEGHVIVPSSIDIF